jgi:hypothetical protein
MKNVQGGTRATRGEGGEVYTGLWWDGLLEIDYLKELGVDWIIIVKADQQEVWWEGTDWNDLAQNRDRWRALMDTIMYFRFP